MTSQKSSANKAAAKFDFKYSFKSLIVPSVGLFLWSAFLFAVAPVINILSNISDANKPFADIKAQVGTDFACIMSITSYRGLASMIGISFFCFGVLFAIAAFRLLMKKQSVNFFFSSSIDRKTFFKNRILSSTIMMLLTIFVPVILDVIVNVIFYDHAKYIFPYGLVLLLVTFVYTFTGFAMMSISMTICHTVVESLFFGAAFAWAPTILYSCVGSLCRAYLRGYYNSSSEDISRTFLNKTSIGNPLFFGRNLGETLLSDNIFTFVNRVKTQDMYEGLSAYSTYGGVDYKPVTAGYFVPAIMWLAISAVLILIAGKALSKSKLESADMHGKNPFATSFFVCLAATALGVGVNELFTEMEKPMAISLLVSFVAVLIASYIVYSICVRKLRHNKKMLAIPAASVVCIGITTMILATGCFGYTTYVPDIDDIEYATITNYATNVIGTEGTKLVEKENFDYALFDNSYNQDTIGVFRDKEDLKKFTEIARLAAEKTDNMNGESVGIFYKLKNGKTVIRRFSNTDTDFELKALSLTDTNAYKKQLEHILSSKNKKAESEVAEICEGSIFFSETTDRYASEIFHAEKAGLVMPDGITMMSIDITDALTDALLADKLAMSYTDRFAPEQKPIGVIAFGTRFNETNEEDEFEDDYYFYMSEYRGFSKFYIYDSMTNTVNYLKAAGLYDKLKSFDTSEGLVKATLVKSADARKTCGLSSSSTKIFATSHQSDEFFKENYEYYANPAGAAISYAFEGNEEITDATKLKAVEENSTIFGWADDDDYLVLLEYKNGDKLTRLLPKEKANF